MERKNEDMFRKISMIQKNYVSCVVLENGHLVLNPAAAQKEILEGRYDFVFPVNAVDQKQKFLKAMIEPMCFYMYKRGDLRTKIDRVDSQKVKAAKRFYTLLMQIKKDIIY